MFYRIIKKELKQKRVINTILFLFMLLATIFVASSVNNILLVTNAIDYTLEKGKISDVYISAIDEKGEENLGNWLKENTLVKDYSINESIALSRKHIERFNEKDGFEYALTGTIMLQTQWDNNMLIYDLSGNLIELNAGEIGMQQKDLDRNNLKLGDTIEMKFGDLKKTFTISTLIMDPAFGGDFNSISRYIISDADYDAIKNTEIEIVYHYNVNVYDAALFNKAINKESFNMLYRLEKETFASAYLLSMVTASIFIIVALCLILISFLIFRFTIIFTIQEDYKEIGIMKAIGIRDFTIKKIYLIKYFLLVSIAAFIGCFLSIPTSDWMLRSVSKTMLLETASTNFIPNIMSAIGVVITVLLLCYFCTHKMRHYTAIDAIRTGQTGERFKRKSMVFLHKCKRIKTPLFMAFNDIFSHMKRFVVLIIIFAIGTLVIILPLNAITSIKSEEMGANFFLDLNADFYIRGILDSEQTVLVDSSTMLKQIESIEDNFKKNNYDVTVHTSGFYQFSYYVEDIDDSYQVTTSIPVKTNGTYLELTNGTTPVNGDEIALSEKVMEKMGVGIGDKIYAKIGTESRSFIITGTYQNFMHLGYSAFMSSNVEVDTIPSSGSWYYQCKLENMTFDTDILEHFKNTFPDYILHDLQETVETELGSTSSQLSGIKITLVLMICCINFLITVLMMKILIDGDKGQIAMLMSIGYSMRTIRVWQVLRSCIVLTLGVVIGLILSIPLSHLALKPIFGVMGATHMKIQTNILEAYLLYPLLLLLVIGFASYIAAGTIRKFNLMEINNAE